MNNRQALKRLTLLLIPLLGACATPAPQKPACYRLPPSQWGACLERARRIDFNVYECERRALLLKPATTNPGEASDE